MFPGLFLSQLLIVTPNFAIASIRAKITSGRKYVSRRYVIFFTRACTGKDGVSFFLVQMCVCERQAGLKEKRRKRYIYTYNTNKYIFLYPLFLERNRRFDNQEKLACIEHRAHLYVIYISLSLSSS